MAGKSFAYRPCPTRFIRGLAVVCAALLAAACGGEGKPRSLLDAAAIYGQDEAVFESIRGAYPGPDRDFTRVPPRDPAEDTADKRAFIKTLRKRIPLDYIDFFPIGDTGGDELNIILNRFSQGDNWHTVSVVFFSSPLVLSDEFPYLKLFERCSDDAVRWLDAYAEKGTRAVFCRLNSNWYAYQQVD